MADYDTFKHGGVTFPLTAATTNSLLRDADPAIFFVLEFYKNQLETHLGSRWTAEAALTSLSGTSIVAYTLPYDPAPYLNEQQIKFPLLAAFRAATNFGDRTVVWRNDTCTVQVAYVLPPLDAGQAERLLPILNGVKAVLDHQTEQSFYSSYTPSGTSVNSIKTAIATATSVQTYTTFNGASGGSFSPPQVAVLTSSSSAGSYTNGSTVVFTGTLNGATVTSTLTLTGTGGGQTLTGTQPFDTITSIVVGAQANTSGSFQFGTSSYAGADVWALSGVEKIELISATFGSYETTTGLNFPSIVCQLQIKERVMPVTGAFGDFVAANVDIDLDNADGNEIADFVSIETNVVPPEEGN